MAHTDTRHSVDAAERRMADLREAGHAVAVRYDAASGRVIVDLSTGVQLAVPAARLEGLQDAPVGALSEIEITPSGLGLHWPQLDADVYLPALLLGVFGSRRWMASQLGSVGGRSRSNVKSAAARENGRKGGRPRKIG